MHNIIIIIFILYIYVYIYIYISIPVCERSKEKLDMYGSYPPGNNYQVLINSQFGVNQINYYQLSLLIENQFAWDRS